LRGWRRFGPAGPAPDFVIDPEYTATSPDGATARQQQHFHEGSEDAHIRRCPHKALISAIVENARFAEASVGRFSAWPFPHGLARWMTPAPGLIRSGLVQASTGSFGGPAAGRSGAGPVRGHPFAGSVDECGGKPDQSAVAIDHRGQTVAANRTIVLARCSSYTQSSVAPPS